MPLGRSGGHLEVSEMPLGRSRGRAGAPRGATVAMMPKRDEGNHSFWSNEGAKAEQKII